MLVEIVGKVGVSVNVNGVLADETVVRFPSAMEDDEGNIGGLSNENGLNELHRFSGAIFGSDGTTKRSLTMCFVGDDLLCVLFGRCSVD